MSIAHCLHFVCPLCSAVRQVELPVEFNLKTQSNLLTVQIPVGTVCNHTFLAFIDRNFAVRGYQRIDYNMEEHKGEIIQFDALVRKLKEAAAEAVKNRIKSRL